MSELFRNDTATKALSLPEAASASLGASGIDWQPCGVEGFRIKPLLEDAVSGLRTWLMQVDAGAFSESHAHTDVEQIYVLEGSFYDDEKTYGAGDFIVRAPGAMHTAGSETGALVLLCYAPPSGEPG